MTGRWNYTVGTLTNTKPCTPSTASHDTSYSFNRPIATPSQFHQIPRRAAIMGPNVLGRPLPPVRPRALDSGRDPIWSEVQKGNLTGFSYAATALMRVLEE